jgi:methionyl-tRNA formyltransferase
MDNVFTIIEDPNPILREPTEDIVEFDLGLQQIIDKMIVTMRESKGVGLAAPQVGLKKKLIVLEFSGEEKDNPDHFPLTILVNPTIDKVSKEKCQMVEGCLSFPKLATSIKRPKNVTVSGLDRWGKKTTIEAKGYMARVLQHEIDHLEGVLLIDRIEKLKTVLVSNMELGLPVMKALKENPQFNFEHVICGEKNEIRHSNINMVSEAKKFGLNPVIWKDSKSTLNLLKDIKPDLVIVAGFGKILAKDIIDLPKYGSLNIHPSLLPKYRGASPVPATILAGDKHTGVSIIKMTEKMDAGPVVAQTKVKLSGREGKIFLLEALAKIGAEFLVDILPYYISGDLKPENQEEDKATYTKMIKKEDGEILEADTAETIERMIRAYEDWPTVWTYSGNRKIQLVSAHLHPEDRLVIDSLKPEGKKEMTYKDFKNGYKEPLKFLNGKIADA